MAEDADDWTLFAGHRACFTDAILSSVGAPSPTGRGRLCLLGAGACNDVDLEQLTSRFSEVHLVDINAGALAGAVSRQTPAVRSRLEPHPGVDLSGVSQKLRKWKRRPPTEAQIGANADLTLRALLSRLPGPFDVVASACVLTQMSFAARTELGDAHPSLEFVRLTVSATHLNTLVGLTAPGGTALFVSDLTSSTSFPAEEMRAAHSGEERRALLDRIVSSGAAYHAAHPDFVRTILTTGNLGELVDEPELLEPWLWDARLGRTYFVYALRTRRLP